MVEIFGEMYYINVDTLQDIVYTDSETVTVVEEITKELNDEGVLVVKASKKTNTPILKEFNTPKYEILRDMISYVMDVSVEVDETLGVKRGLRDTQSGFKIVFNTLIKYNILTKI